MLAAVLAHENTHLTHFQPELVASAADIEYLVESLSVPYTGQTEAQAIAQIRALPAFGYNMSTAQGVWLNRILPDGDADHAGPAYTAERTVLDGMINTICAYRTANGWAICSHCP